MHRPGAGLPGSVPVPGAIRDPFCRALAVARARPLRYLRFHQTLGREAKHLHQQPTVRGFPNNSRNGILGSVIVVLLGLRLFPAQTLSGKPRWPTARTSRLASTGTRAGPRRQAGCSRNSGNYTPAWNTTDGKTTGSPEGLWNTKRLGHAQMHACAPNCLADHSIADSRADSGNVCTTSARPGRRQSPCRAMCDHPEATSDCACAASPTSLCSPENRLQC